jgi:hypothetical protein
MMKDRPTMSRFGILPARVLVLLMLPFAAAMAQNHNSDTFRHNEYSQAARN